MERQDTQPLINYDDFDLIMQDNTSIERMTHTIANNSILGTASLFDTDDENMSSLAMATIKMQEHQQLQLLQQQPLVTGYQIPNQLQITRCIQASNGRIMSAQLPMPRVKRETKDSACEIKLVSQDSFGAMYQSGAISSTPPEVMQAVPYSQVQSFVPGNMSQQYNAAAAHGQAMCNMQGYSYNPCYSAPYIYNAINTSQQLPVQVQPRLEANKELAMATTCVQEGTVSESNIEQFQEIEDQKAITLTSAYAPAFSPGTVATTEIIQNMLDAETAQQMKKEKFSSDTKYTTYTNSSPMTDLNLATIPRTKSIDVTTLEEWPGDYGFDIEVPTNTRNKTSWCYSSKLHQVYCFPGAAMEVRVKVSDWEAAGSDSFVRVCAVFRDPHHRTSPVNRCHNCMKDDNISGAIKEHLVQVNNSGAVHTTTGARHTVVVPLVRPHVGQQHVMLLIKIACMTSCLGGPNRRPFVLVFSFLENGVENGRRVLPTKCCKGGNRDLKKDEDAVVPARPIPAVGPGALVASPKKPAVMAGPSTEVRGKRRSGGKKSTHSLSSDSESDRGVCQKKLKANYPMLQTCVINNAPVSVPHGYSNLIVPSKYKDQALTYIRHMMAFDHFDDNSRSIQDKNLLRLNKLE